MKRKTLGLSIAAGAAALLLLAFWLLSSREGTPLPPAASDEAPSPAVASPVPVGESPPADPPPRVAEAEGATPVPAAPAPAAPARRVVVEGKVVGLGDEPIPRASVHILADGSGDSGPGLRSRDRPAPGSDVFALMSEGTTTGEDGTFRLEIAARPHAGLIAWGGGYANTLVPPFSLEEDARGLLVRMEPAVAFSGRVLEAAGRHLTRPPGPIEGVNVSVLLAGAAGRWTHLRTVTTDADGRFRTWGWMPGRYDLFLAKEGFQRRLLRSVEFPGEDQELRLLPAGSATLSGTVRLPEGGEPATGVRVRARTPVDGALLEDWVEGATDGQGRYQLGGLDVPHDGRPGFLEVRADGGARGAARILRTVWTGGSEVDVDLLAPPATVLRIRVVDAGRDAGRAPVAGLRLAAQAEHPDPLGRNPPVAIERTFVTDKAGSAEVRGLPDRNVTLSLPEDEGTWEFDRARTHFLRAAPAEGPWEVEIEAYRRARVQGQVVDPGGEPVAGARVEAQHGAEGAAGTAVRTDADGRFTLSVPSRRPLVLRATAAGFLATIQERVTVDAGSTLGGILLRFPVRFSAICGRVLDAEGNPRPEVQVRANACVPPGGPEEPPVLAWTGAGGRYRIEVPSGVARVIGVELPGFRWEPTPPLLPGDPVPDIVLRPLPKER